MEIEFIRSKCVELMWDRSVNLQPMSLRGPRSFHCPSEVFSSLYMRFLSAFQYSVPALTVSTIELPQELQRQGHCTRLLQSLCELATEQQYVVVVENVMIDYLRRLLAQLEFQDLDAFSCAQDHRDLTYGYADFLKLPSSHIWFPNTAIRKRLVAHRMLRYVTQDKRQLLELDGERLEVQDGVAYLTGCREFITAFHDIAVALNIFSVGQILEAV